MEKGNLVSHLTWHHSENLQFFSRKKLASKQKKEISRKHVNKETRVPTYVCCNNKQMFCFFLLRQEKLKKSLIFLGAETADKWNTRNKIKFQSELQAYRWHGGDIKRSENRPQKNKKRMKNIFEVDSTKFGLSRIHDLNGQKELIILIGVSYFCRTSWIFKNLSKKYIYIIT
jgi:hypothetical protein